MDVHGVGCTTSSAQITTDSFENESNFSALAGLDDWQALPGLLPSEWRQLGSSSGAVRGLRGFPSLDALWGW